MFIAVSVGWLPGIWFFPLAINRYSWLLDPSIYQRFAISFSLAWLISATTSLAVTLFVLARALYPKYWQGRSDLAVKELRLGEGLCALLMVSAALVPMAGTFMMVLMAPHEYSIDDYRAFTSGFVSVRDERIAEFVRQQFAEGVQWPDPWLSLNPSFASGGAVPDLVREGLLHPECERIFRRKSGPEDPGRLPIVLHQHQRQAVEVARTGKSYVLT